MAGVRVPIRLTELLIQRMINGLSPNRRREECSVSSADPRGGRSRTKLRCETVN